MPTRLIRDEGDRESAATWVLDRKPPFRLTIETGSLRSLAQNSMSHKWYAIIADQRGDMTQAQIRAECKLIFGVPILKEENPEMRESFDRILSPHSYETQLDFMQKWEIPVTRIMTTKQLSRYLDDVYQHFAKHGIRLPVPEEQHRQD